MSDADFVTAAAVLSACPGLSAATLASWATAGKVRTQPDPRRPSWRMYHLVDSVDWWRRQQPTTDDFTTVYALVVMIPGLSQSKVETWAHECEPLGRPVRSKPHPRSDGWRVYCVADVQAAWATRLEGRLPDEFTDARGRWLWLGTLRPGHPLNHTPGAIRSWRANGHPATGGKPLASVFRWSDESPHGRWYVRAEDLAAIGDWYNRHSPPPAGYTLGRDLRGRFDKRFLYTYGDHDDRRRKRDADGRLILTPHPALQRSIRTKVVEVPHGNARIRQVWFNDADLARVESYRAGAGWEDRSQATVGRNITPDELLLAVRRRDDHPAHVHAEWFPSPPGHKGNHHGRRRFYLGETLDAYVAWRASRKALGRPVLFGQDRRHTDDRGRVFWRLSEARWFAGVSAPMLVKFRTRGCEHLPGGRAVEAVQIAGTWRGSLADVWVYLATDLDVIWQAKHGTKGRRRSKPTGNKRGRQSVGDAAADAAFVAAWKASGEKLAGYAKRTSTPIAEAEAICRRHRANLSRERRAERTK